MLAAIVGFGFSPPPRGHKPVPIHKPTAPPVLPCGDYMSFQVLLDRQGFSPGEIDGRPGENFTHTIAAFQQTKQLPPTAKADCDTWRALGGDHADPVLTTYTVSAADLKGPFEKQIPSDMLAQAKLPALDYRSPLEMIGERFHVSPALLTQLNHNAPLAEGRAIDVPAVQPFDPNAKPPLGNARGGPEHVGGSAPAGQAGDVTIQVSREESALRAVRPDGSLAFFAPVTTGSVHDPLPPGHWTVVGVDWHPAFHYNPNLFWDAKPQDTRATIKPGPNNPVGVVWISLNLEHYGLHGTPEPGRIGHTESHGCVRLTNWDAVRVASLVKKGTAVVFE